MDSVRSSAGGEAFSLSVILYLDVYMLVNFVMDLLILCLSGRILRLWPGGWRLAGGALAGSLWACLTVVVPALCSPLLLGSGGAFMVLTAFGGWSVSELINDFSKCGKEFLRRYLTVLLVSAAAGGVLAAAEKWPGQWRLLPLFLAAAGIWSGGRAVLGFLQNRAELQKQCYQVTLFYQGKEKQIQAFLDTGNRLYEPYSHQPVHVLSADACTGFCESLSQVIYIPYRSVGKAYGMMPGIRMERMKVYQDGQLVQVWERPWIGISRDPVSPDHQYEMLLHS